MGCVVLFCCWCTFGCFWHVLRVKLSVLGVTVRPRGSYSIKYFARGGGGVRPEVQPLTLIGLLYTIFARKGNPFCITHIADNWHPFHIPSLEISIPCCKCNVLKISVWINYKTRTFSWLFYSRKMHSLPLLGLFTERNERFLNPFKYFN